MKFNEVFKKLMNKLFQENTKHRSKHCMDAIVQALESPALKNKVTVDGVEYTKNQIDGIKRNQGLWKFYTEQPPNTLSIPSKGIYTMHYGDLAVKPFLAWVRYVEDEYTRYITKTPPTPPVASNLGVSFNRHKRR